MVKNLKRRFECKVRKNIYNNRKNHERREKSIFFFNLKW